MVENFKNQSKELGRALDCPTWDSKVMIACMKARDAETIAKSHLGFIVNIKIYKIEILNLCSTIIVSLSYKLFLTKGASFSGNSAVYGPTVEAVNDSSAFITEKPIEIMEAGKIAAVPFLSGVNSAEGLSFLIGIKIGKTNFNSNA